MVMFGGWFVFSARNDTAPLDRKALGTRFAGFLISLATSCGLATLHFQNNALPQSAGGALGELIGRSFANTLGSLGSTLLLLALWLAAISIFTGLSWLAVMDGIGQTILEGFEKARALMRVARERAVARQAQELRKEGVRVQRRKAAEKQGPRIEPELPTLVTGARAEKEVQ